MEPAEQIAIVPVRDHAAPIEEARRRKQERAGADRGRPPRGAGADLKPFDQARILGAAYGALSASYDQSVERLGRVRQRLG